MLPKAICFVDVETTGMGPVTGRIIEIGILRVEGNKVVEQFSSLVNPQITVDPFIQTMTGITQVDLKSAPSFYSIKNDIKKILKDSLFVAHNVLFDYSFLKNEFERLEEDFSTRYCCSVKLSKYLYPKYKRHNLDEIIQRLDIKCKNRHRALDDAKVIFDFYKKSLKSLGEERLVNAFSKAMKRPSRPIGVGEDILDTLPRLPGVYIFYNKDNTPLYIGKSVNIRDRVLSHFANSKRASLDMKIAQNIARVEAIETAGELGALLLEATLVKKMQPLYNRQLRYAYKLLVINKISSPKNYHSLSFGNLQDVAVENLTQVLGIFKSKKDLRNFLISICKEYNLCLKMLGLEKGRGACFNYHLNLCFGACLGKEMYLKYNLRFDSAFFKTKIKQWPFKGPIGIKEQLISNLANRKEEIFVIDKWCVLGKLEDETQTLQDIQKEYLFDTDTYKILNRFLTRDRDFEVFPLN